MPCNEKIGTLICYAGSASEASIDSEPIGNELKENIPTVVPVGQEILNVSP